MFELYTTPLSESNAILQYIAAFPGLAAWHGRLESLDAWLESAADPWR
ncbi:MAG: hypothetical protein ACE5IL_08895 [Myxococcota bacterium]